MAILGLHPAVPEPRCALQPAPHRRRGRGASRGGIFVISVVQRVVGWRSCSSPGSGTTSGCSACLMAATRHPVRHHRGGSFLATSTGGLPVSPRRLRQRRQGSHGLLPLPARTTSRARATSLRSPSASRDAAHCADRMDEPPVGDILGRAGRRDQGRQPVVKQMLIIVGSTVFVGVRSPSSPASSSVPSAADFLARPPRRTTAALASGNGTGVIAPFPNVFASVLPRSSPGSS